MDNDIVTIETVGEGNYNNDPICKRAVDSKMDIQIFIGLLLEDRHRLYAELNNYKNDSNKLEINFEIKNLNFEFGRLIDYNFVDLS